MRFPAEELSGGHLCPGIQRKTARLLCVFQLFMRFQQSPRSSNINNLLTPPRCSIELSTLCITTPCGISLQTSHCLNQDSHFFSLSRPEMHRESSIIRLLRVSQSAEEVVLWGWLIVETDLAGGSAVWRHPVSRKLTDPACSQ